MNTQPDGLQKIKKLIAEDMLSIAIKLMIKIARENGLEECEKEYILIAQKLAHLKLVNIRGVYLSESLQERTKIANSMIELGDIFTERLALLD